MLRSALWACGLWCAGVMPAVSAVTVDGSGRGQVLLFPYYSALAGEQTLLALVNHSNTGKALKLRFREASNGRVVQQLNLYLGEFDVWTAAVLAVPQSETAVMLSFDSTCSVPLLQASTTLPKLPSGTPYLPFDTADYTGERADGGASGPSRTFEGWVEVIEMGALVDGSPSDRAMTQVNGVPRDCPELERYWRAGGAWTVDPQVDLLPPIGQLAGSASVVSTAEGAVYSVDPVVLNGYSVVAQHTPPTAATPDLSTAVTDVERRWVAAQVWVEDQLVTSRWPQAQAIDAVSAVLSQQTVDQTYTIETGLAARSQWVLTLPTRPWYTDAARVTAAVPPYTQQVIPGASACEIVAVDLHDREGRQHRYGPAPACLCQGMQRLEVSTDVPATEGACQTQPLATRAPQGLAYAAGFARIGLDVAVAPHALRPSLEGHVYRGLPLIGLARTHFLSRDPVSHRSRVFAQSRPVGGTQACTVGESSCAP